MHRIYFEKKCICLRDWSYRILCSIFKDVDAAGGLVTDNCGNYLMIRRNGIWDLPKGHKEYGEDIRLTAVREVEEETGVKGLDIGGIICITNHCYRRDGRWHIKHTWWYEMSAPGNSSLEPQTEEGISEVEWISKNELQKCMDETFPSIREVFETFFKNNP